MATKTGAVISKTIDWIKEVRKNKLIAAVLLLIQGIMFILKPETGPESAAKNIAIFVLIGCVAYLTEFFVAKDKKRRNKLMVAFAAILGIAALVIIIKPALVSSIVIYVIAVMAILNGLVNLYQLFKLNKGFDRKKIVGLVINILTVGLGISLLFTGKDGSDMMTRLVGIVLVINALSDLWTCLQMHLSLKKG